VRVSTARQQYQAWALQVAAACGTPTLYFS
jgi:hypothetical protein